MSQFSQFRLDDCYAGFVNLEHRKDRLQHMISQLDRAGISAVRHEGILSKDKSLFDPTRYRAMINRTPGAIGCYLSQMKVMEEALRLGKSALVMEDDLVFCSDFRKRVIYIENFINYHDPDFDVFWLGGTFHVGPPHWHNGKNQLLPGSNLGRDAHATQDPRVFRTFGCFSTHAYIVNKTKLEKILSLLELEIPTSIGIDYSFIRLQPHLQTYSFVPGCVKQIDNQSDIGNGVTVYSGFSRLNGTIENSRYWWQDKMEDFDPEKFDWKESSIGLIPKILNNNSDDTKKN